VGVSVEPHPTFWQGRRGGAPEPVDQIPHPLLDGASECRGGRRIAEDVVRLGKVRKGSGYVGDTGGWGTVEFRREKQIDIRDDSR
jgi:hypothetical protein